MAKVNGSVYLFYVESSPGVWQAIGSATSSSLGFTFNHATTGNKGTNGWQTRMYSTKALTATFDGFSDPTDTINEDDLYAIIAARTPVMVRRMGFTQPIFYEFNGQIQTYTKTMPNEDAVSYNLTFKATGKPKQYIMPVTAEVPAAGTTIIVDTGIAMGTPVGSHASWSANDGGARTFTAAAAGATPNLIVLTLSGAAILGAATVTLSYSGATAINGVAYGTLAPFTAKSVTNNSTQT